MPADEGIHPLPHRTLPPVWPERDALDEAMSLKTLEAELLVEIAGELRRGPCGQNLPRLRHLQAALGRVRQRQESLPE